MKSVLFITTLIRRSWFHWKHNCSSQDDLCLYLDKWSTSGLYLHLINKTLLAGSKKISKRFFLWIILRIWMIKNKISPLIIKISFLQAEHFPFHFFSLNIAQNCCVETGNKMIIMTSFPYSVSYNLYQSPTHVFLSIV